MYRLIPIYWLGFLWGLLRYGVPLLRFKLRHTEGGWNALFVVCCLLPVIPFVIILQELGRLFGWIKRNLFAILFMGFVASPFVLLIIFDLLD